MENIINKKPKLNPEQTIHNWLKVVSLHKPKDIVSLYKRWCIIRNIS